MDWKHEPIDSNGVTLLEFIIPATPTDGLTNQKAGRHVGSSSIKAEWRARLELELQIACNFGILSQIAGDSDEFPYKHFSIFERNNKIWRDLMLRERKRKIEADQDDET